MSRRQRNNISRMPWEHRRIVCRMLFEGATYEDIRAALDKAGAELTAHNNSLAAYRDSNEYTTYADRARQWRDDLEQARAEAAMLNDGRGPESQADLIIMDVLRSLRTMTAGAAINDAGTLAKITRALKPVLDREADELKQQHKARLAAIEAEHQAEVAGLHAAAAEKDAVIAAMTARIAELTALLDQHGVNPDAATPEDEFSPAEIRKARKLYGIK